MSVSEKKNIFSKLNLNILMNSMMKITQFQLHNGFPLAPQKLAVSSGMRSKYCKKIVNRYVIKVDDVKKLIPNLGDKTNYVLYYRNLLL